MNKVIYLDNAATTRVSEEVVNAMIPYYTECYGNPSAVYTFAGEAKKAVTIARESIAKVINARPDEIYFTGGGSESDNWVLKAVIDKYGDAKGKHIITTSIEHHAILHTCEYLEKKGCSVTYVDVDEDGVVKLDELKAAIRPETVLISVMTANNEVGTIQPIDEIGKIAKENNILFHTDAVQAFGHIDIDVKKLNIDFLSASAHKINGPKGIGFMYIERSIKIGSFIHGGAQERQRRAGTLNVPAIVGFGKAAELAMANMEKNAKYETELRNHLVERILNEIPYSKFNGSTKNRLPNNANFSFKYVEGESMLILLDQKGICSSSGSACTSGSIDPSHVLTAMGIPDELAHGSIRLTLSCLNTLEEIDYTVDELKKIIERLREMSPLYK